MPRNFSLNLFLSTANTGTTKKYLLELMVCGFCLLCKNVYTMEANRFLNLYIALTILMHSARKEMLSQSGDKR